MGKIRFQRERALARILSLSCCAFLARAQNPPQPAAYVVRPHTYVSLEPVPRGKQFQAAIVIEIARGYHMNSHRPTDPYLIPTTVTPQVPSGFQVLDTLYPKGKLEKFAFSPNTPLDVYSGSVTILLRLATATDAALGPAKIPMTLRYQACNDSACLPPVRVPVEVKLEVAAPNAKARAEHPEIFASTPPKSVK